MNAANFFYYSVGAFAVIGIILMIAIAIQVFLAVRQIREILYKLNNIRSEAQAAKEKMKLGLLELVSYAFEKIRGASKSAGGGE